MKGNFTEARKKDMEFGEVLTETVSLVSGKIARPVDMVCTSGRMEISMRVSGGTVLSMDMALISSLMEILTKDLMKKANLRVLDSTNGRIVVSTLASF